MSILSNFQQKDPCPFKKNTHLPTVFVSPFWSPCVICPLHLQHQWNRFTTFFHRLEIFEWIQMAHETAAGYTFQMEWKHVDFLKTFCRKPFFPPQTNLQTPEIHIKIYRLHFVRYLFWSAWTECNDPRLLRRFVVNLQVFACFFMCQTPSRRGLGSDSYHQRVKGLRK